MAATTVASVLFTPTPPPLLPLPVISETVSVPPSTPPVSKMPKIMAAVASCESGGQQFDAKGHLIRDHVTGTHIGMFQIGLEHTTDAKRMGYDIYTKAGNISYALYMYKKYGLSPWLASASCWS